MGLQDDPVLERLRHKKRRYEAYGFSREQERALWAFFDLAQEYETLENFYRVCVLVPKEFLGFSTRLYLYLEGGHMKLVADSSIGLLEPPRPRPDLSTITEIVRQDGSWFFPFKGNKRLITLSPKGMGDQILGILEVFPADKLSTRDKLFFQKFANRIGYNLHIKFIFQQSLEHIKFINTLVADIEHNVIIPNMYYRVLFRRLARKIDLLQELVQHLREGGENLSTSRVAEAINNLHNILMEEYQQIEKHYETVSLFLESLLRRDHFQKGHFVLRKRTCRFAKEVIEPQLERYKRRFEKAGIMIDNRLGGVPDEELIMAVDVGLLSQVYANLFSNALKYTCEVKTTEGEYKKFIAFGREIIPHFFGPGKHGIKFNVFTTGPHLSPEEAKKVFEEGWRGNNIGSQPGSGRGLHFVKKVIELHGGVVGYEPTPLGNNFYFVLPLKQEDSIEQRDLFDNDHPKGGYF